MRLSNYRSSRQFFSVRKFFCCCLLGFARFRSPKIGLWGKKWCFLLNSRLRNFFGKWRRNPILGQFRWIARSIFSTYFLRPLIPKWIICHSIKIMNFPRGVTFYINHFPQNKIGAMIWTCSHSSSLLYLMILQELSVLKSFNLIGNLSIVWSFLSVKK